MSLWLRSFCLRFRAQCHLMRCLPPDLYPFHLRLYMRGYLVTVWLSGVPFHFLHAGGSPVIFL